MIKKLLSSKKGESLIESLISILVFSVLIATVTLIIATALRITAHSTQAAYDAQIAVNEIIEGNNFSQQGTVSFTFIYVQPETPPPPPPETDENDTDPTDPPTPPTPIQITVTQPIMIHRTENNLAFRPN